MRRYLQNLVSCSSEAAMNVRKGRRWKGLVREISGSMFARNGRKQCKVCASAREWIDRGRFSNVVASEEAVGRTLLYLSFPLAGEQEAFKD